MNWYKHHSNDRNETYEKLIRNKFGAIGYGIHITLLEIIAGNVKSDNYEDWGCVPKVHDTESLAIECGCTIEELNAFFIYVDEKEMYQRKNGMLFYPEMLNRLDDYAERIKATKKKRKSRHKVGTTSYKVGKSRTIEEEREVEVEEDKEKEVEKEVVKKPIEIYLTRFNTVFQKNYGVTEKRQTVLSKRLKNYKLEDILRAIDNLHSDPFYRGENDRKWQADPDFLIRTDEQVDKWINNSKSEKKEKYVPIHDSLYKLAQEKGIPMTN